MNLKPFIDKVNKEWDADPTLAIDELEVIRKFGKIFHPNNLDNLTADEFRSFYSFTQNRHWHGLERTAGLAKDFPKIKKTLKILLDETIPIKERIKRIRDDKSPDFQEGFAFASYTPILLVVYPTIYCVINEIVKESLERIALYSDFDKEEWIVYDEVNKIITEFAQKNNLSLWKIDSLWSRLSNTYDFTELKDYIHSKMDAKANYQPVMLMTIIELENTTKEIIDQKIREYNPQKNRGFISREVYETLVDKYGYVIEKDNTFQLNLVEPITDPQKEELITLCKNRISGFKIKNELQYFLIQVSEFGSQNLIKNGYYQHEDWQETPRDSAHGEVKIGDLLLVYFASKSIDHQMSLKMVYQVESITKNNVRFQIKPWRELRGLSLESIRNAIESKKIGTIFEKISQQGFNIAKITPVDFEAILRLDGGFTNVVVNDEQFKKAHQLFEEKLLSKSNGVSFTNFNHPVFLEDEINYKIDIISKTNHLRSLDDLHSIRTMGTLLKNLREACSPPVSKNLLMGTNYGPDSSSAASLFQIKKELEVEYEKILSEFFIFANNSHEEFGKKFDEIILFLQKNDLKTDWRFLAYLAFIANPEKYFPIHPTQFEKLLQFYGNQYKLRANFSWKLYSIILELAEILKIKLAKYGRPDAIQIQSYMWVVSKLIDNQSTILDVDTNYWMIRPGTGGENWTIQKNLGVIGISFYDEITDLNQFYDSQDKINEDQLRDEIAKYEEKPGARARNFGQYLQFMNMKKGDLIIAEGKGKILGVGRVIGKYKYQPKLNHYHTIPVEWYDLKISGKPTNKLWQGTIMSLTKEEFEELVSGSISKEIPKEYDRYLDILSRKKQVIFYGPPGTGKTRAAKLLAELVVRNNTIKGYLTFRDAAIKILYDQKKPMHYDEITNLAFEQNLIRTEGETPQFTLLKVITDDIKNWGEESQFKKTSDGVYELNTEVISEEHLKTIIEQANRNKKFVRNVTFHQSYSYEEFIEGIKPRISRKQISYGVEPGIFRKIIEDAHTDDANYVLIIDEINRGNISKIFGELITLIENDKRTKEHALQLAYSHEDFWVPENLYIIGTMNTADRSLVQIDAALRRRFAFIELMPQSELIKQEVEGISLSNLLTEINSRIIKAGLREKQIGHSYFMPVNSLEDLQFVFANEIVPLLQDYFFDDYKKLQEDILSEYFVDSENLVIKNDWKNDPKIFLTALKETFPV